MHAKKQGEMAWPALLMFKALLLQGWYGSRPTLAWRRNRQLLTKGLVIKAGEVSIVGAAVIEAKQRRLRKDKDGENAQAGAAGLGVKVAAKVRKPVPMVIRRISTSTKTGSSRPLPIHRPTGTIPMPWKGC